MNTEVDNDTVRQRELHVTLLTHYFPNHRGGVEIVAGELAQRLAAKQNCQIDWFASDCDLPPADDVDGRIRYHPQATWNVFERCLSLPWPIWLPSSAIALWRSIVHADVIHLHDFIYCGSLWTLLIARILHKPVLITQHIGLVPYRSAVSRTILKWINRYVGAFCLQRAQKTIFISEAVKQYFSEFVRWRTVPQYLPNGVDSQVFHPAPENMRRRIRNQLGFGLERPIFLFVGRFTEKKGLANLRALASAMPEVDWVFAGHGSLHPSGWMLPNVRVFEGLSGETLAPLYQMADLFVLPSYGEGFPLVLQEAMSAGLPCMVNTETALGCPAAADLLLCESCYGTDVSERWSQRLKLLLGDTDILNNLRWRVAQFAVQHWSWDRCAADYAELLRSAAGILTLPIKEV